MNQSESDKLFTKALTLFPGGVNSPVRAFKSVGGTPLFMKRGKGCRVWDEDENEYIDFCTSWGPLILGHASEKVLTAVGEVMANGTGFGTPTRLENELADLILSNHRFLDKIRFVSSGTEAVMSGLRLARGFTGRSKVLKFDGCYHGHVDALLVSAGSGLATLGTASSAGVSAAVAEETIVVPLNDIDALNAAFERWGGEIACAIIEPVPANNGLLIQPADFLQHLRTITEQHGSLLFFDEVISGFRVGFEGAAGHYNIQPDLLAFGKILGGGLPVGAYGGRGDIMRMVAPEGPVYQAGTLSGNPVAMAAGLAQLTACLQTGFYENLAEKTECFMTVINSHANAARYPFGVSRFASIFWLNFSSEKTINQAAQINPAGMRFFARMHRLLLESGVYLGPSGYEVGFVSAAHTKEDLEIAAGKFKTALDSVFA